MQELVMGGQIPQIFGDRRMPFEVVDVRAKTPNQTDVVVIDRRSGPRVTLSVISGFVNYDIPKVAMIAAGEYDSVDDDIAADESPILGQGLVEVDFVLDPIGQRLNRVDFSMEDALRELDANGFPAGGLPELLAFGAMRLPWRLHFPIIAPATQYQDDDCRCRVPGLYGNGSGRRILGLFWREGSFASNYHFLSVFPKTANLARKRF
jgi:hypothetical protein